MHSDRGVVQFSGTTPGEEDAAAAAAPSAMEVSSDPTPVSKTEELRIKHDWYQVAGWTTVDVFIKKADPANVSVEFTETTLSVDVKLPNGSNYKCVTAKHPLLVLAKL